jgi:hypothetical protein
MKNILLSISIVFAFVNTFAQITITEGKIVYDIFITNNLEEQQGELIITFKNNFMKREMKMKNGYANIILFDASTGKSVLYNELNGNKLSKILTKNDVIAQNQKFANAIYTNKSEIKTIANNNCNLVNITYQDGTNNLVYYNENFKIAMKEFYSMFPELKGVPFQYQVGTKGNTIILIAKSIESKPIDNIEIEAPKGYKAIK